MITLLCVLDIIIFLACFKIASDSDDDAEKVINNWIDEQGSNKKDESMRISHD